MIIDFHAHLEYKQPGLRYTATEIVQAMDQGGVDVSVLLGNDQADAGAKPAWADPSCMQEEVNRTDEEIAAYCSEYPSRLIGFTSIHPDRYQAYRKIERAVKEFGMRGVKLYPHAGFYPNDRRLDRVYETCAELDIPVMIHTGIKAVTWQRLKYNSPVFVDDVAVSYPELKIVMSHGGYPWSEEYLAVVSSNPNILADLTFMEYIEKAFDVPRLVESTVRRLVNMIGAERILWGSEGPFMSLPLFGEHGSEHYQQSMDYLVRRFDFLDDAQRALMLGGNARRLLKMDRQN